MPSNELMKNENGNENKEKKIEFIYDSHDKLIFDLRY